jgi:hypothetical protein
MPSAGVGPVLSIRKNPVTSFWVLSFQRIALRHSSVRRGLRDCLGRSETRKCTNHSRLHSFVAVSFLAEGQAGDKWHPLGLEVTVLLIQRDLLISGHRPQREAAARIRGPS